MKDLSDILGDPTESFTAEVIWNLQHGNRNLFPKIVEVARSFHDEWHIPCHEALERIHYAQAAGEVMLCYRPDKPHYLAIEDELGLRITARVAYFNLVDFIDKPSMTAEEILRQYKCDRALTIDLYQQVFGTRVVDCLAIDLGLSLEQAFNIVFADPVDPYEPGDTARYADTLNLYLRYREDFAA